MGTGFAFLFLLIVVPAVVGFFIYLDQEEKRAQLVRAYNAELTKPKTIEQLDQEAAWLRAESRRIEAEVEHKAQLAMLRDAENFLKNKS